MIHSISNASAKLKKSKISSGLFKIFMDNILQVYQEKLRMIELKDTDKAKVEEILSLNGLNDLNENHRKVGATLHIFGKFKDPTDNRSYYSLQEICKTLLGEKGAPIIPFVGDHLYKLCLAYRKGSPEVEVFNVLFKLLDENDAESFCQNRNLENKASPRKLSLLEKIEENFNGIWWLLFYNNESFTRIAERATAILEVRSLKDIRIFNYATDASLNYIGTNIEKMQEIEGILYLQFEPINRGEKRNLRMDLHISDNHFDIVIGQYTNTDGNGNLIRGSVGLQLITDKQQVNEFEQIREDENKIKEFIGQNRIYVDDNFDRFFENRDLNFNRLPGNLHKLESFGNWIEKQRALRNIYKRSYREDKLFISCPISSVDESHRTELRVEVEEIKNLFEKNYKFEVFAQILDLSDVNRKESLLKPHFHHYRRILQDIKKCNFHLVIWPHNLNAMGPSGVLFEIGLSAMADNPITIFHHIDSEMPYLVQGACEDKNSRVQRIPYRELVDIKKIINECKLEEIFSM